jgi:pyridoxine 4-dehydrogenase
MTDIRKAGTFKLGDRTVKRLGYGAMQLAGKGVFGPPKDRDGAIAVLREAIASGVDHIDTSDFYGPHVTNQIIREALHPYADDLVIVTKVGARRGEDGSWNAAFSKEDLTRAVHDNLRNLGVDALDVVNLRLMFDVHGPAEGSLEAPLTVLAELQQQGLIRHLGLSNVTRTQVAEGRAIANIVGVQNQYNLAHRHDDALIDELDASGARVAAAKLAEHPADSGHFIGSASARKPGDGGYRAARRCAENARSHGRRSRPRLTAGPRLPEIPALV